MSLVRPSAHTIRDGVAKEIGAEAVVIGDVLILRPEAMWPQMPA